ncbi:isoprenylcysteine carboxyl methyltransferase [Erythrobacter sp. Dej080120_24]|uniref:methyltransferase family protein n=1 Tax=unclassified Erythrobacter TaxID=2633097 RepID=UPI002925B5D4|nr:isoprenylcysteine carboxyl methyltransferase [Erythrobacter sp. Dej080120_24]
MLKTRVPPPLVALCCAGLMWGVAELWPELRVSIPLQWIWALLLIGAGLAIDLVSVAAFLKARTTVTPLAPEKASSLVTGGFYRFTRNPMYLGMLLILTGIALLLASPINIAILGLFIAYITAFQIKPEEALLEAKFGEEYREYKQSVRRWL